MKTTNKNIFRTKKLKNWFTLVELIVVITILAILVTIWFVSFQWFLRDARDGNRVASVKSIWEWLELSSLKVWKYPEPDKQEWQELLTWALLIDGQEYEYSYLWEIWETVMRTIWLVKETKDPMTWNKYTYAITKNGKEYQIASILEWNIAKWETIINKANAASYKAKVDWNHRSEIIYDTWTKKYLTVVLSMIFDKTWWNILNSTWAILVVDKKENVPYWNSTNTKKTQQIIKEIRWDEEAEILTQEIPEAVINWTQSVKNWLNTLSNSWVILKSIWAIESNSWWIIIPNIPLLEQIVTWNITTQTTVSQNSNCSFNGNTVEHWTSVTVYLTENVAHWSTCTQEQRTCTNGTLSWSYTYASCEVAWATGTFSLSNASVVVWTNVTITNNCSVAPTSYASSDMTKATISWTTITTVSAWTTEITPVWWACGDNAWKTLTITPPPTREVYWDEDADAIAACNLWVQNAVWANAWWYSNWIWVPARNFTTDWVWTALSNNFYKRTIVYNGTNYICNWFAVMKYEAKFSNTSSMTQPNATRKTWATSDYATDNDTYPVNLTNWVVSKADDYPIASIRQWEAIQACGWVSYSWVTSHLITDNEWMWVARNIEQVSSNWSWWSVWNWFIYNWHNDWWPQSTLAASTDDNNWYYLTNDSASAWDGVYNNYSSEIALAYQGQRRTLALSNGKVIWDLAWNVWEHVNKRNNPTISNVRWSWWDDNNFPTENMCSNWTWNWYSWYNTESISWSAIAQCSYLWSYSKADFWPSWNWNAENGMWRIYANNSEDRDNIFLRGGRAHHGVNSGVFSVVLELDCVVSGCPCGVPLLFVV